MVNPSMQPSFNQVQPNYTQPRPYASQAPAVQTPTQEQIDEYKKALKEQSMAISFDLAAEYSAISRMSSILGDIANQIKIEEDPQKKSVLEVRLNTLNNMILQREGKVNQMELTKNHIDKQAI